MIYPTSYTLIATDQIAGFGTSYQSVAAAKNHAIKLQSMGLCKSYSIGQYRDGKHIEIYNSNKDYATNETPH